MSHQLISLRSFAALLKSAARNWSADRAPSMGAAIAYYTVFSLAPLLILAIALAGIAFGQKAAEGALFGEIAELIGADSAGALEAILRSAGFG